MLHMSTTGLVQSWPRNSSRLGLSEGRRCKSCHTHYTVAEAEVYNFDAQHIIKEEAPWLQTQCVIPLWWQCCRDQLLEHVSGPCCVVMILHTAGLVSH